MVLPYIGGSVLEIDTYKYIFTDQQYSSSKQGHYSGQYDYFYNWEHYFSVFQALYIESINDTTIGARTIFLLLVVYQNMHSQSTNFSQ